MSEAKDIAGKLTEAERAFVLSLSEGWKHWPCGIPSTQLNGLRGFGKSGLIESRYEQNGVFVRPTPLGLEVRSILQENSK